MHIIVTIAKWELWGLYLSCLARPSWIPSLSYKMVEMQKEWCKSSPVLAYSLLYSMIPPAKTCVFPSALLGETQTFPDFVDSKKLKLFGIPISIRFVSESQSVSLFISFGMYSAVIVIPLGFNSSIWTMCFSDLD